MLLSSFHLWSSKCPTEKRSLLSRGLLGPQTGIITPKEDEIVKLALNLRRYYLMFSSIIGSALLSSGSFLEGRLTGGLLIREDWRQAHLWLRGGLV